MRDALAAAGLHGVVEVMSAGAFAREGELTTPATLRTLAAHGIAWEGKPSRQVTEEDAAHADYVLAMDRPNLAALRRYTGPNGDGPAASLLLDYAPQVVGREVPDPFGTDSYDETFALIQPGVMGLLAHIRQTHGL